MLSCSGAVLSAGIMNTVDCFHAASLADLWDRLENGETRRAAGPGAMFVSQAAPDAASAEEQQDPPRHAPPDPDRLTVSMNKSAMILMRKTVLAGLEMGPCKRDEFLARMKAQYFADAKAAKASESEAREWAQYIVHKVRKTIDTVEGPGVS